MTLSTQRVFLAVLLILASLMAWQHYFMQDDAYISFRYAKNFTEGNGLVWYPHLREFGYTNFLFTISIACLMGLGMAPEIAATSLTFPAFIISVVLTVLLARRICRNQWAGWLSGLAVATHYTISSYASGGMETSVQTMFILSTYYQIFKYCKKPENVSPWSIALFCTLALLCRLDSALLLFYAYLYLLAYFYQRWNETGRKYHRSLIFWRPVAIVTMLPLLAMIIFLSVCSTYYGAALPNTFYAKVGTSNEYAAEGFTYFYQYLNAQLYFPIVLLALMMAATWQIKKRNIQSNSMPYYLLGACVIWTIYLLFIGGDFMEFRMLVPMLPLFYIACFTIMGEVVAAKWRWAWALFAVVILGVNIEQGRIFEVTPIIDTITQLDYLVRTSRCNWATTGTSLRKLFYTGAPDDVSIAVHPAGAIPYFSGLPTVDLYGLNDRWTAQHGAPARRMAGHRRRAPYSYLADRKVNIIIDFPAYYCPNIDVNIPRRYSWLPTILIPLDSGCYLIANYMTQSARVDELIDRGIIKKIPVDTPVIRGNKFKISFPPFK